MERLDVLKMLKEVGRTGDKYLKEVELPLHEGTIGSTLAKELSKGINPKQIPKLVEIIKKHKERGIHEHKLMDELSNSKRNSKNNTTSIVSDFRKNTEKLTPVKSMNLLFSISAFDKLEEEKRKRKIVWSELMVPVIEKNIHLFLS